ncbi:unnamed protein product [Calypogeia fissa]
MQQSGRGPKVSLRGASAKEVSRDVLLEKVAQERASRLLAKKTAASALLIQRVWRGRRAAQEAADLVQADWDAAVLHKQPSERSFFADIISKQGLRPLLFLVSPSSFSAQRAKNSSRLVTGFKLLLESINSSDLSRNYCSLAIGSRDEQARWLYQVHKILELCGTVLANDGHEWSDTDKTLPGLTVRVMVALTDATMWKGFSQKDDQVKANALALNLLEWLAKGHGGLFPAIRSYIISNYPIPKGDGEHDKPPDRDKFIVTASAITLALRPLVALSAASQQELQHDRKQLERLRASSARAAVMFATHILTIPFLIQRLPGTLVPALQHTSALAPCLRTFGVSINGLVKVATAASSSGQLSKGEQELAHYPISLWALANVVSLACGSVMKKIEFNGQFVKGLVLEEYVQALCCLLNDLAPWVERKQQETLKSTYAGEDIEEIEAVHLGFRVENSPSAAEEFQTFGASSVFHLLYKTLRPLYQSWHLVLLVEACEGSSKEVEEKHCATESYQGGTEPRKRSLQLTEVAKLYSTFLVIFSLFNQNGGRLPILNLLAFSKSLLPRLWEWLQISLKLQLPASKGINRSQSKSSSQFTKSLSIPKDGNSVKPTSGKWAAALGLKMRIRSTGAEGSSSSDQAQTISKAVSDGAQSQLWDLQSMRSGPAGVPDDAVPVLSLFCASYAHLLMVVDDEEFYERQVPFTMDQQRLISAMLNTMVYNGLMSSRCQVSLLTESAVRCLRSLYERDCRRSFCEPALWLAPAVSLHPPTAAAARAHHEVSSASSKMRDSFQAPGVGAVLTTIPHVLPFEQRVHIFREFVRTDKSRKQTGGEAIGPGPGMIEIAVRRDHVVEDGFAHLHGLGSKLKSCINVSFVNELGLSEAGLDYGGLFKEFLTNLAKAAFDPGYGLFVQTATEEGLLFPHPAAASLGHGLPMIEFLGQIIGKALYEGILLEYSFAPLFVSKLLGRYSFLDELSTLDAELHRNLMYLKHYEGDARDLALDFTVTEELFGKHTTVELRPGGANIAVTNENKLQYVHAMADYKLNRQMRPIISAFSRGLSHLIDPAWLGLFNAKEFNQLLSGGEHDFDVEDLRAHTRYTGGFTDSSRTVKLFWEVVAGLEAHERCALLKFVTSCSRAPLLGFKHLQPAFTIHKVVCDAPVWAIIGGQDVERLPSASTCYNTLKLPTYKRLGTLREKLRYAILSNAGFELS